MTPIRNPSGRRAGFPAPAERWLLLVLGLLFALLLVVGWRYRRAAAEHRRVLAADADRRVAWVGQQVSGWVMGVLYRHLESAFSGYAVTTRTETDPARLAARTDSLRACRCGQVIPARYFFRYDLATRAVVTSAGAPEPAVLASRLRAIDSTIHDAKSDLPYRALAGGDSTAPWLVVYLPVHQGRFAGTVVGLEIDPERAPAEWYQRAVNVSLVPAPDTGAAAIFGDNLLARDSLLAGRARVVIRHPSGAVLYANEVPAGKPFATWRSEGLWPPLITEAALLSPSGLDPRLPADVTPLLLATILLGALLVALALVLQRRAAALAAARMEFLASVTHELRTPLTQIGLTADALRERPPDAAGRDEGLRLIQGETRRLAHLVENALAFTATGRADFAVTPVVGPLAPLVTEVVRLAGVQAGQVGSRVTLALGAAPEAAVDQAALRQVLVNLLDNAIRYGPPGQEIVVRLEADPALARILVEDQGPGVPESLRESVFEPFVRGQANGAVRGSGLGLAVAARLVRAMRGRIEVVSRTGGGSVFRVELPRRNGAGEG